MKFPDSKKTMKRLLPILLIAQVLMACSASPIESQTKFALACANGDARTVQGFIRKGDVDLDAVNGRIGPCLVASAYSGHDEIVNMLLKQGADINVRDEKGTTPLMNAVAGQQVQTVRLLLEKGADQDISLNEVDKNGVPITVHTFAAIKNNEQIIQLLEDARFTNQKQESEE